MGSGGAGDGDFEELMSGEKRVGGSPGLLLSGYEQGVGL